MEDEDYEPSTSSKAVDASEGKDEKKAKIPPPKMKIKTISRNPEDYTCERRMDINKVFRNPDPKLHPFEKAREFTRATIAAKLSRMFSSPFLFSLDGHGDSINCMATMPNSLVYL